jgi:hypothetical protein
LGVVRGRGRNGSGLCLFVLQEATSLPPAVVDEEYMARKVCFLDFNQRAWVNAVSVVTH